jgi:hypothetical protein
LTKKHIIVTNFSFKIHSQQAPSALRREQPLANVLLQFIVVGSEAFGCQEICHFDPDQVKVTIKVKNFT